MEWTPIAYREVVQLAVVDRSYRGDGAETIQILISDAKRSLTPLMEKLLLPRNAIEPENG